MSGVRKGVVALVAATCLYPAASGAEVALKGEPLPRVTYIAAASGEAGASISIYGVGLAGVTAVRFGTSAASFTTPWPDEIIAIVPPGSGTVPVVVESPAGESIVGIGAEFSYLVPVAVTTATTTTTTETSRVPVPVVQCHVPNVLHYKLATARRVLSERHCALGSVTKPRRYRGTLRVVSQGASAGQRLAAGALVTLKLAV